MQQLLLRRKHTSRIMEDYAFLCIYESGRNALNSAMAVVWAIDYADHDEADRTPLHSPAEGCQAFRSAAEEQISSLSLPFNLRVRALP